MIRGAVGVSAFVLLYVLLDWVSVIEPFGELGIAPWNPPAGLIFALLLALGAGLGAVVFAAVVLADLLLRGPSTTPFATIASALTISIVYAVAAEILRRRLRVSPRLNDHRNLWRLLAVASGAAAIVATAVVWTLAAAGLLADDEFALMALRYWVGDVIGIAVLTPFILLLLDRERRLTALRSWTIVEAGLQLAAIALALSIIFGFERAQHFEYAYVLFLPLVWIALRDGLMGATWGVVATQLGLIIAIQMKGYDAHVVTQFQLLMLAVTLSGLFLGAVVDERRRAESSLREHAAELAHAGRLAATGEMAAAMAHELNQPLTAVIGFVRACQGLLRSERWNTDETRHTALELVDEAAQQATRAGQIIRSTREFLRRDDMRCVRATLPEIVGAVLDLARTEVAQKGVQILTEFAPELPAVLVDPIQIEQVLLNLIRNSIEAMARAGSEPRQITVSAAMSTAEPDFIELSVRDTGPGIPPEVMERLFTPFVTTKPAGMGLGLSISRSIIEAHGGRIRAGAAPNRGTEFTFTVPSQHGPSDGS